MKRIVMAVGLAATLAGLGLAREARAQTVTWNYTLVTVDAVSVTSGRLYVTGIPEGGATPIDAELPFSSTTSGYDVLSACQRVALMAMERPGQYKLLLSRGTSYGYPYCRLVRVTP